MRILHTSDWHLGQHFMSKSREPEHRAFLDWLLQQIDEQQVDVLVIAGDVFDTGAPPSYARQLYNNFMVALQETRCWQVFVVGGNHDSVAVLHEARELLACLDVTVIGGIGADLAPQVCTIRDPDGEPMGVLCAVPYLRPRDLVTRDAGESVQEKQQGLQQAIADHYEAVFELAQQRRQRLQSESDDEKPLPIIGTGHLATLGGQTSESVRDIYIGSLDAFPASQFPALDYLALGHFHQPQQVAGQAHLRYCGAPIALSFDELGRAKQVLLVDFDQGQFVQAEPLLVPCFQPMCSVKGSLESLRQQLLALPECEQLVDGQPVWLEVEVQEDDYLKDLQSRLQTMIEDLPVELLRVRRQRGRARQAIERAASETLAELSVGEVYQRRLAQETHLDDDLKQQLQQAFDRVLEQLQDADADLNKKQGDIVAALAPDTFVSTTDLSRGDVPGNKLSRNKSSSNDSSSNELPGKKLSNTGANEKSLSTEQVAGSEVASDVDNKSVGGPDKESLL